MRPSRQDRRRARRVRGRRAAEPVAGAAAFRSGEGAVRTGRASGGRGALPAGLEREPRSFYGYYTLGVVHQKAGAVDGGASGVLEGGRAQPRDPRGQANLAGAALRTGNLDLAAVQFERMIELGYQVAPAQFNLGVIAAKQAEPDRGGARSARPIRRSSRGSDDSNRRVKHIKRQAVKSRILLTIGVILAAGALWWPSAAADPSRRRPAQSSDACLAASTRIN